MTNAGDDANAPLSGIKVLDLTEHLAGPMCTMVLADMGAEVIKIERPGRGEANRNMGDGSERNPYFLYINRNKKSLTLDYKHPAGRELFLKLVADVDILVENYRPTVMPRAKLGYDELSAINPGLIYGKLSGFGADGPDAARGGFDLIAQGVGGIMHVTGEEDGPPMSVGLPICDVGTGMWAVQGILAALYQRSRTGKGQLVKCSLLETAIGFSSWTSAGWLADGKEPTRQGSRHRQNAPYQRMATQDGYIMLGAVGDVMFERCATALGRPDWVTDPRFDSNQNRKANRAELEVEMESVLTTKSTSHWVKALDEVGIPCGPVNTYEQLFNDPQVKHLSMVVHAQDPELGDVPHIRVPIDMEGGVSVRTVAPKLGEHTQEVLAQVGVSDEMHAKLKADGVI